MDNPRMLDYAFVAFLPVRSRSPLYSTPPRLEVPLGSGSFRQNRLAMSSLGNFSILSSIAAIEIGILISSVLFGIIILQAFIYFTTYTDDPITLKALAGFIWLLEFAGMICIAHLLYAATITTYREAPLLMFINPPTQINVSNMISATTACLVEAWLTERVRRFTGLLWAALVFWFLILLTFAGSIAVTVVVYKFGLLEYTTNWRWISSTCWILSAVIDVSLAALLCYNLVRQRQSMFQRSTRLVDKIMMMTMSTGLLTSLMAIATTILAMVMPYNLIYMGLYTCTARIYANSFFASLNARNNLRSNPSSSFKLSVRGRSALSADNATDGPTHSKDGQAFALRYQYKVDGDDTVS
ncbi:hypothetical protein ONZ45_g3390 [Pleurotus djamor]|nr:hypothetical protein ONZ45_g3390 [Pleurotus djamor]